MGKVVPADAQANPLRVRTKMNERTQKFKSIQWRNFKIRHTAPDEPTRTGEDPAMRRKRALDEHEERRLMAEQREVWE